MEEAEIRAAAPITFLNVLLLSLLFAFSDMFRRMWMVNRPVRRIRQGMKRIIAGDFQARIPYIKGENSDNEFDDIIRGLNEMAAELSGVETLRTDFVSNVSHEIKTPLAVIQNYGTMLQNPQLSDAQRMEYAKAVTEQTRKLSDLISNILKLNRLENQQIYPDKKTYNLTEQICECLLVFEHAWEEKGLEIETDLDEDVMICQDEQLLSLVWNNLFSNAVKFSKDGGKVEVKVRKEDDDIFVTVSDDGCGISPEVGRHIFEKFYQGDTSHATQGNGLGLALVKRVIDIVGGDISVQSALGEGTTFCVCLKEKD
ncbi:MAG: HAMP domain-containing histidine kinase [Lachnospiraceae bacterium]|nr:HAMP domain-containing histidine kinase [Lachnospiraceae bacterium]